ncbi:MAG: UDP-N-acetylglucosamine 2-epimerase (non-hydrolyzing), partial [Dinghuibacter sp.]|nr:UDP-N-acetylglucosamine 2-epimerase (non-hydrolyzing) [Dinghuibacter sp.]
AAALSMAFRDAGITEWVLHTGQHYDYLMSEVFWKELGIQKPYKNCEVGSGFHGAQTARILENVEAELIDKQPKALLVFGDTNSTLGAALAAAKLHIPVYHVEAGLRSYNRKMPEEINRVLTDHVSELLFCSSQKGVDNLAAEGITQGVHAVGDIMYSALLNFRPVAEQEVYHKTAGLGKYYLMTIHREENTSNTHNLKQILKALGKTDARLVWPIHPRTKKIIEQQGIAIPANLEIRDPFSYLEMLNAINGCTGVITDSGGVQKEAYWLKKRCITIRTETEWVETLAGNWNMLVNPNAAELAAALAATPVGEPDIEVYGDGRAHHKIAELIGRQWV